MPLPPGFKLIDPNEVSEPLTFGGPTAGLPEGFKVVTPETLASDEMKIDAPPVEDDQGLLSALGSGLMGSFLDVGSAAMGVEESLARAFGSSGESFRTAKAKIQQVRGRFTPDDSNTTAKAGYLIGNIAGNLMQGAATAGAGTAIGLVGKAKLTLPFAREFLVGGDQAYDRAKMSGASERQAQAERFVVGGLQGLLGTLEVNRILKFDLVNAEARKRLVQLASRHAFREAAKQGTAIGQDLLVLSLANGLQEATQEGVAIGVPALSRGVVPKTDKGETDWKAVFGQLGLAAGAGAVASGMVAGSRLVNAPGPATIIDSTVEMPFADAEAHVRQSRLELAEDHPDRMAAQAWVDGQKKAARSAPEDILGDPDRISPGIEEQTIYPAEDSRSYMSLADQYQMDVAEAQQFHQAVATEELLDAPLTPAEQIETVRRHLGKNQMQSIFGGIRQDAVDHILNTVYVEGGAPVDVGLRQQYLTNLANQASVRTRQMNKTDKLAKKGKEANLLNVWSSASHAMEDLDVASGRPVRRLYANMVQRGLDGEYRAELELEKRLSDYGISQNDINYTIDENRQVAKALGTGDPSELPDKLRPIYALLKEWFSTDGRTAMSVLRWDLWNDSGIVPSQIDPAFAKQILAEGRAAASQGKLGEWLKSQTWTARENYYMSDFPEDIIDELGERLIPGDLTVQGGRVTGQNAKIREAMTRRNKNVVWKEGPVVWNALNHMKRLYAARAIVKDLPTFWKYVKKAGVSKVDASRLKEFTDNILGRTVDYRAITGVVKGIRRGFWRFYFANPIRGLTWSAKNFLQQGNILAQLRPKTIASSLQSLADPTPIPGEAEAYAKAHARMYYNNDRQWSTMMMVEEDQTGTRNPTVQKLIDVADKLGRMANRSEVAVRSGAWRVYYRAATSELGAFKAGQTWEATRRNLMLDTLTRGQQNEIIRAVDTGRLGDSAEMLAEWKVSNTHFRYELPMRSQVEQDILQRGLIGLYTYPRGLFELFYHGSLKPLADGLATGDRTKYRQGMMALLGGIAATASTRMLYQTVMGKELGTVGYQPLDPGVSMIVELFNDVDYLQYTEASPDQYLALAANQLEFFIPMADWYVDFYESINDAKGVKLWKLLKTQAVGLFEEQYGTPWKKAERNAYQKVVHTLSGGFESPAPTETTEE